MNRTITDKLFTTEQLRRLIAPLIVEQLLVLFVGMLDTLMVSHAGEAAVSGVSIVNEVNYLIITILTALSAGGAVVVSQYIGNHNQKEAGLAASQMMMISTLTGIVMMSLSVLFCKQILNLLYGSVEPEVMKNA
ncbi:MAG: MATE family efflux transporter, partial [Erysipelotrichaceae bacterium]|nr:MATE family efflux transporter [Erysipelotrichaceae bacterium]